MLQPEIECKVLGTIVKVVTYVFGHMFNISFWTLVNC